MQSYHHFYDTTPTIFDIVLMLFLSPHPLYWWHHTNSIYEISSSIYVKIISIIYNSIITIFVPSQPLYLFLTPTPSMIFHPLYTWHLTHNIWYHSHCICMVTPTLLMPSQKLWKSSHLAPVWYYTHFISHLIHPLWHQSSVFMTSQNTAFMTSDLLYMTLHPLFRKSHHNMYDIMSSVSDLTSTVSVSSHPHYWWHHSHYMDGIISSISVISYPL